MQNNEFDIENSETVTVKCPNCGANMLFDPQTQQLKCSHCDTLSDFEKSSVVKELDVREHLYSGQNWSEESVAYHCENCGATVVLAPNQAATVCPYCSTSHVVKLEENKCIKPNALFPFTKTEQEAFNFAAAWAKKQIFAPSKFKKNLNADKFKGVYQPAFTFDSKTHSTYQGRIGKRHTRTVGSGKNRRVETYIVWRYISGDYSHFFDDVTVNGDTQEFQTTLNKLMPFDYSTIKEYDTEYLTGYMAKRSDRNVGDCWDDAKKLIERDLRALILSQYVYDVVDYLNVTTIHKNVTFKHVLMPVYVSNFNYKNKDYRVFVNGNTGKVTGKTPISPWRVALAVILGLAVIALIGYLIYTNS